MGCPFCKTKNTMVENSRETRGGSAIWRRRQCQKCMKIFSTYESVELDFLVVQKRNGKNTRYLGYKLFASLYDATSNAKSGDRGDAAILAHEVLLAIEKQIIISQKKIVSTKELIDMATSTLETRDLAACYRYASFSPHRGMKFGV